MRGDATNDGEVFSYVMPEERIPADHPLRRIKKMVNEILKELSPTFDTLYSAVGRPSIAPEQLLRALLLQVLYTIRSERMLMEQLDYNVLFRWFVGLNMDDRVWNHSTFSKNRERLMRGEIAGAFFVKVRDRAEFARLTSDEHFTVDGTLIQAWASLKSFKAREGEKSDRKGGDDGGDASEVNFHGEKRSNETHQSQTDPQSRLFRKGKGKEAKLYFMGHVLMENRNGLVVDTRLTVADGISEREAALEMINDIPGSHRITVGADKGYDAKDFVEGLRELRATPHVAAKSRATNIDHRVSRHTGYLVSQRVRKRIEEVFGWMKTVGSLSQTRHRGLQKVGWVFTFTAAAFNLVRIERLLELRT
jgi:transposase